MLSLRKNLKLLNQKDAATTHDTCVMMVAFAAFSFLYSNGIFFKTAADLLAAALHGDAGAQTREVLFKVTVAENVDAILFLLAIVTWIMFNGRSRKVAFGTARKR